MTWSERVCQHTPQRGHGAGLERLAQLVDALGGVRAISFFVDTAEGVAIKAVRQVQESDVRVSESDVSGS